MQIRSRYALPFLALLIAVVTAACGGEGNRATLRIASDATFPPFHFLDEDGRPAGFDIELARELARDTGLEPEVVVLPYDELFTGLAAGTHDVVAATTGITVARQATYLFSIPYFSTCQAAVVRSADSEPTTIAQLATARVAASGNGTARAAMLALETGQRRSIDDGEGVRLLNARTIDAWIVDEFDAVRAARASNGRLRVLPEPVAVEDYGLVLAAHNGALKQTLDEALTALIKDGRLAALRARNGVDRDADWPIGCRRSD